jgi:hypothetical protein
VNPDHANPDGSPPVEREHLYGGWQAERSGFMGRMSVPGFACAVAALVLAMAPVYADDAAVGFVSWPLAALLVAVSTGRIAGLPAEQWLALFARHRLSRARGRHVFASGVFAPRRGDEQPMDLPGVLAAVRLLQVPTGEGDLAVVFDPHENAYSAVLAIEHPSLALSDVHVQNRRVGAWGAVLASLCVQGSPVSRLAVLAHLQPDDGSALATWTAQHTDPARPPMRSAR